MPHFDTPTLVAHSDDSMEGGVIWQPGPDIQRLFRLSRYNVVLERVIIAPGGPILIVLYFSNSQSHVYPCRGQIVTCFAVPTPTSTHETVIPTSVDSRTSNNLWKEMRFLTQGLIDITKKVPLQPKKALVLHLLRA